MAGLVPAIHVFAAEIDPPSEREMADRCRDLADGGFLYFVAERDGKVRGSAYAGPYRTRVAYR